MPVEISFRGQSGRAYPFIAETGDADWAARPGVALFAAPDSYGWRVIKVVTVSGKPHDLRPFRALAEAERYGASTVFHAVQFDPAQADALALDLERGLDPVCRSRPTALPARTAAPQPLPLVA